MIAIEFSMNKVDYKAQWLPLQIYIYFLHYIIDF